MTTIRVIDLETTGLDAAEHKVVEVGWRDVVKDRAGNWLVDNAARRATLINPGRRIPPEASAVHHIMDEDVRLSLRWEEILPSILQKQDILCAHNAKFERQWCTDDLTGSRPWICTYKCAMRLWPDAPGHSNQVLRYWRQPAGLDREEAEPPHRAGPDAYVTAHLLRDMLNAGHPVDQLIEWSGQPALLPKVQFGKHVGLRWPEVPSGYLDWILSQDFDEDVVHTARSELARRKTESAS